MKWERAALVLALAGGALLRIPCLDLRPMHTDEAVHATKFGALLENGTYRYDRHEYHGPTLNYFTLLPAWLTGSRTLPGVTETTLRIVPVFFGLCLLLLILLLPDLSPAASASALLLTAFSPAMVFYSRYYIQETLLVCFSFGLIVAACRLLSGGGGQRVRLGRAYLQRDARQAVGNHADQLGSGLGDGRAAQQATQGGWRHTTSPTISRTARSVRAGPSPPTRRARRCRASWR